MIVVIAEVVGFIIGIVGASHIITGILMGGFCGLLTWAITEYKVGARRPTYLVRHSQKHPKKKIPHRIKYVSNPRNKKINFHS